MTISLLADSSRDATASVAWSAAPEETPATMPFFASEPERTPERVLVCNGDDIVDNGTVQEIGASRAEAGAPLDCRMEPLRSPYARPQWCP
jgi:hypothetical protein